MNFSSTGYCRLLRKDCGSIPSTIVHWSLCTRHLKIALQFQAHLPPQHRLPDSRRQRVGGGVRGHRVDGYKAGVRE